MNLIRRVEEQSDLLSKLFEEMSYGDPRDQFAINEFAIVRTKIRTWKQEGCISFKLSDKLIEAFKSTDIPMDMYPEECKYPFDCFMIEGDKPLFNTNIKGNIIPVHSILFVDRSIVNKMRQETKELTFVGNDGQVSDASKGIRWFISLTAFYEVKTEIFSAIESMVYDLREGETISKTVEDNELASPTMLPLDSADVKNLLNIFFNTVLYINDPTRVVKETEEVRTENIRESKGGKFIPSKCIKLRPPIEYINNESIATGKKLDKRFRVRGHWRNQAFGVKLTERKRIWIKPHWKGPEWSEVLSKPYKID